MDSTTTKELLSENEIEALLDIFTPLNEEKNAEPLFEAGMAKVAEGIEYYLERVGLQFDDVSVFKNRSEQMSNYSYTPDYLHLENISIENPLALGILAARFGAEDNEFSLDRALTSLEKQLLEDFCKEIAYMVEKELESYLLKDKGQEKPAEYSVLLSKEKTQYAIQFSFTSQPVVSSSAVQQEELIETADVVETKIEALLGTIAAETLEEGVVYKLQAFAKNRAVLLLDESSPFMAEHRQESEERLSFVLQEALTDKTVLDGYCLCIAVSTLDDEALLALEHGTVLALKPYDDAQIHKDGKMVAKAKVSLLDGEITVRI